MSPFHVIGLFRREASRGFPGHLVNTENALVHLQSSTAPHAKGEKGSRAFASASPLLIGGAIRMFVLSFSPRLARVAYFSAVEKFSPSLRLSVIAAFQGQMVRRVAVFWVCGPIGQFPTTKSVWLPIFIVDSERFPASAGAHRLFPCQILQEERAA
jgi:hypothetical protein